MCGHAPPHPAAAAATLPCRAAPLSARFQPRPTDSMRRCPQLGTLRRSRPADACALSGIGLVGWAKWDRLSGIATSRCMRACVEAPMRPCMCLDGAPVRARVYSCMYSTYAPTRVCMRRPRATAWVRAGGELHEERRCDDAALRVARRKEAMRSAAVPQGLGQVLPHSAPGPGSLLSQLRRDCAHPCHICAGTGLTPATSAPGLGSPLPAGTLRHDRSCRWTA